MLNLTALAALVAAGYGFVTAGIFGALTGLVAVVGVGSGLAISVGEISTGVAPTKTGLGHWQRRGGILAAFLCGVAAYYGGWTLGWVWGIGGYAAGVILALLGYFLSSVGRDSQSTDGRGTWTDQSFAIPRDFDLNDYQHVLIIDDIREQYSLVLADETLPYADCMYRPASTLPYPKEEIQRALIALLDYMEGRTDSDVLDPEMRTEEGAEIIRRVLVMLESYLDIPQEALPKNPQKNARVGAAFVQRTQNG